MESFLPLWPGFNSPHGNFLFFCMANCEYTMQYTKVSYISINSFTENSLKEETIMAHKRVGVQSF